MTRIDDSRTIRPGLPPEDSGYPGYDPRTVRSGDLIAEYDITVPLRDGGECRIDVFRPTDEGTPAAVLIAWGPYGKHSPLKFNLWPGAEVKEGELSPLTAFEAPDPVYWTARGYAVINVDPRGTWGTPGTATFQTRQEGEDYYDLIEWAGTQAWSNGRVGLAGVSYLAMSQWQVAALRPPHLAAINPWEGVSDAYRELAFHGGIPERQFLERWQQVSGYSSSQVEDLPLATALHPLDDSYWKAKVADLSQVQVAAYVLVGWADQGCHTRGTLNAFTQLGSERKWLEAYAGKKLNKYYQPEFVEKQRAFFDRFLLNPDTANEVDQWPEVLLEVSSSTTQSTFITPGSWPIPETRYTTFALDVPNHALVEHSGAETDANTNTNTNTETDTQSYDSEDPESSLRFRHTFTETTRIVGHAAVRLWMSTPDGGDMDVFVALEKYDREGNRIGFHYLSNFEDGAVALGWLRASHRRLDAERSLPWRPYHTHTTEQPLGAGEVVPLDIEIWASASEYHAGESIELQIQGSDIHQYAIGLFAGGHPVTRNRGRHTLHAGGRYDSQLVLPLLP